MLRLGSVIVPGLKSKNGEVRDTLKDENMTEQQVNTATRVPPHGRVVGKAEKKTKQKTGINTGTRVYTHGRVD